MKRILYTKSAAGMEQMNNQGAQQASELQTNEQGMQQQQNPSTSFMDPDEAMLETLQVIAKAANQAFELQNNKMAQKGQMPMNPQAGLMPNQPAMNNNPSVAAGQGTNPQSQNGTMPPTQGNSKVLSKAASWDVILNQHSVHPSVQPRPINNLYRRG